MHVHDDDVQAPLSNFSTQEVHLNVLYSKDAQELVRRFEVAVCVVSFSERYECCRDSICVVHVGEIGPSLPVIVLFNWICFT